MALSIRLRSASDERTLVGARNRTVSGRVDLDPPCLTPASAAFDVGDDLPHHLRSVDIGEPVTRRARFHPAEVEQRLDQALQARRFAREHPVVPVPPRLVGTPSISSISAICRTVVRGERNSCDTAATKSDCRRAT